jgi:hypothetical protein
MIMNQPRISRRNANPRPNQAPQLSKNRKGKKKCVVSTPLQPVTQKWTSNAIIWLFSRLSEVGAASWIRTTLIQNPYFIISTNYNLIFHGPNSLTNQVIYNIFIISTNYNPIFHGPNSLTSQVIYNIMVNACIDLLVLNLMSSK